jgi:hypothetical protein
LLEKNCVRKEGQLWVGVTGAPAPDDDDDDPNDMQL